MSKKLFKYALLSWGMVSAVGQAMGGETEPKETAAFRTIEYPITRAISARPDDKGKEYGISLPPIFLDSGFSSVPSIAERVGAFKKRLAYNTAEMAAEKVQAFKDRFADREAVYQDTQTGKLYDAYEVKGGRRHYPWLCGGTVLTGSLMTLMAHQGFRRYMPAILARFFGYAPRAFGSLGLLLTAGGYLSYGFMQGWHLSSKSLPGLANCRFSPIKELNNALTQGTIKLVNSGGDSHTMPTNMELLVNRDVTIIPMPRFGGQ